MTIKMKELPENEANTLATRLRDAREAQNLSRADVSKRTGIPAKSIEKFEFGTQEPSVSRLLDLANVYGKSIGELIGQEAVTPANDPAPPSVSQEGYEPPAHAPAMPAVIAKTVEEQVTDILYELDELREADFERSYRTATALIETYRRKVKFLEPDALLDLADNRGLYRGECPSAPGLFDLFILEPEKAETYCGSVEERILDTAILGVDLFCIQKPPLTKLAHELARDFDEIEEPFLLFDWGSHCEFIPQIRGPLRELMLMGRAPSLSSSSDFERR